MCVCVCVCVCVSVCVCVCVINYLGICSRKFTWRVVKVLNCRNTVSEFEVQSSF